MMWQQWRATRFICTLELLLCQWHAHCVPVKGRNTHVPHPKAKMCSRTLSNEAGTLWHMARRGLCFCVASWCGWRMIFECHFVRAIHDSCPPWCGEFVTRIMNQCTKKDGFIWTHHVHHFLAGLQSEKYEASVQLFENSEVEESKIDKDIFHEAKQLGCYVCHPWIGSTTWRCRILWFLQRWPAKS